jgi:hypothetical protein
MKAKSRIMLGTALLLAVATAIAWHYVRLNRQAENDLAALGASQNRVAMELQQLKDRPAAPKASLRPAPPVAPAAKPSAMTASLARIEQARRDPKVQLLQLAADRARAARTYGILFRKLGLTPAQTAKFLDNVANRNEQLRDINAVLRTAGSAAPISPEAQETASQLRTEANTDYQAAQQDLLGNANYPQLQEYERIVPAQNTVSALAGTAVLMGAPFTAQQAQQLTQVLVQNSSNYQKGGAATGEDVDWDVVDAQAQSFLTESQMDILKNLGAPQAGRFWAQFNQAFNHAQAADAAKVGP